MLCSARPTAPQCVKAKQPYFEVQYTVTSIRGFRWRAARLNEMGFGVGLWNWPAWDLGALEKTGANFTIMNGYLVGRLADHEGADMLFIAAGMGGGTGTGCSPVIANYARETDALVVGVAVLPFKEEGSRRRNTALEGLKELKDSCHCVIELDNEKINEIKNGDSLMFSLGFVDYCRI